MENIALKSCELENLLWTDRDKDCLNTPYNQIVNVYLKNVNLHLGLDIMCPPEFEDFKTISVLSIKKSLTKLRRTVEEKLKDLGVEVLKSCQKKMVDVAAPPFLEGLIDKAIIDAQSRVQQQTKPHLILGDIDQKNRDLSALAWKLYGGEHYYASTKTALEINIENFLKYKKPVYECSGILTTLTSVFRQRGDIQRAIKYQEIIPYEDGILCEIEKNIKDLLKQDVKDYSLIFSLASRLKDHEIFYLIVESQINEGLIEEAFDTTNMYLKLAEHYKTEAYKKIALYYLSQEFIFDSTVNNAVKAAYRMQQYEEASKIWKRIEKLANNIGNVELAHECYINHSRCLQNFSFGTGTGVFVSLKVKNTFRVPDLKRIPIVKSIPDQEIRIETWKELIKLCEDRGWNYEMKHFQQHLDLEYLELR